VTCAWRRHPCTNEARHYLGGGLWVCFEHFLKAFGRRDA
jgi:hypothetical protein